jgi:galactokinase
MISRQALGGLSLLQQRVVGCFRRVYGGKPALMVAAPGRVNLIGEHTDYNEGFVLPAAIDRHIVIGATARSDRVVRVHAADFDELSTFGLDDIQQGMDMVIAGDVPIASGLSSSASIEVATAYAFQCLSKLDLDGVRRALLCQRAENEFVGMRCGIMDQYIISLGKRDHALMIDCRSLGYQLVPIPPGCSVVVCDTKKRRGLVDSEYNTRRQECETGARLLGVRALRDVTPQVFEARQHELGEVTRKRCRHIVTEDQRVLDAVQALRDGDVVLFGRLMNASHVSLRDDYQVSCRELDIMVEVAARQEGVLGARMTGAGFGGCTVNLVQSDAAETFGRRMAEGYTAVTGLVPDIYVCLAEEGVRTLE